METSSRNGKLPRFLAVSRFKEPPGRVNQYSRSALLRINELKAGSQGQLLCRVIYFFCYHRHEQFRSADAILRALIVQLLGDQQTIPDELEVYLNDLAMFSSESSTRLFDLFQILVENSNQSAYYFVIDALDECEAGTDRAELLSRLQNLCTESIGSKLIKFFFTSRPGPQEDGLEESLSESIHMYLQADLNGIAKVIDHDIKGVQSGRNRKFILHESDAIIKALSKKAGRTYIWIRSIVKELRSMSPPTLAAFQALVDSLPTELDLLYRKLVERFLEDDFTTRLLLLVAYAKRPLQIEELIEAIAVGSCNDYSKLDDLIPYRAHLNEEEIRDRAGTPLEVTRGKYVSLIHQSVMDFLVKENPFRNLDAYQNPDLYFAKICCIYLCSRDFESAVPPINDQCNFSVSSFWRAGFYMPYKLLPYASQYWDQHIKDLETGARLEEYVAKLVSPQLTTSLWWRMTRDEGWFSGSALLLRAGKEISTKFHIAIKYEIEWLASLLLRGYCQSLLEPFPKEEIVYTAKTNIPIFLVFMEMHECHQLAFNDQNIPLAIATVGDLALHHMERYCNSLDGKSPFPREVLRALAQSQQGLHKTFEFLITRNVVTFITKDVIHYALSNPMITARTIDMLLSRSEKLTAELIYAALRNCWELALHLIKKHEAEVGVEGLLMILDQASDSKRDIKGLLNHLYHFRCINITKNIVTVVNRQDKDVRLPFMDALVRQTSHIYVEPEAAELICRHFPISFTRVLLQQQDISISGLASILEASALSEDKASKLDLIFEHLDEVVLTKDMIRNAVSQSMLRSVVRHYARDYLGLCKLFLQQIGVEEAETLCGQRISDAARLYDGAVTKYILERSADTFISDDMLEASAGLPSPEVMEAMHEHRAKQNICNLPIPPKVFTTVLNNPSPCAFLILEHLISLDGGVSMTHETLDLVTEAIVVMTTTVMPPTSKRSMLGVLLRTKSCRRVEAGISETLYKAAVENLHPQVGASMLERLLDYSSPGWQPTYALLEAAARNSFDTFQLLQEHKRSKILQENIPENLVAMKQSMSPEILLAAVGNNRPESKTPRLLRYILDQPGCLDITHDVWRNARSNPTYGNELDSILMEFISRKSQDKTQDSSQENDVNTIDGSEELSADFLLQDMADSDASSWDEESEPGDGEHMNYDIEDAPSEEQN